MSTTPTSEDKTLIADLEVAASLSEVAGGGIAKFDPHVFAARLRDHARRLVREIELASPGSEYWNSHVTNVLTRINNGPVK